MPTGSYSFFAALLLVFAVQTCATAAGVSELSVQCSETTEQDTQGCANAWVRALMAADDTRYLLHSHAVSIAAGSIWKACGTTDQEQSSCIDNWINLRQPASLLRGIVDGDCLTAMLLPSREELAAAGFGIDHLGEFFAWYQQTNGVSWDYVHRQLCLLNWVLRQQRALKEDGGVCAFMATAQEKTACLDKWVTGIINQERGQAVAASSSSSASSTMAQLQAPAEAAEAAAAAAVDGDEAADKSAAAAGADDAKVPSDDGAAAASAAAILVDPPPVINCARGKRGRLFRFPQDLSRTVCIDDWVNAKLCHRQGSSLTNCPASCTARFATTAAQRACVYNWLEAQQILSRTYGSFAATKLCTPANYPDDAALQACYHSYVMAVNMQYKGDDQLEFGAVCDGPYGGYVNRQECVLKLIRAGTGNRCEVLAGAGARQRCERRWMALQQIRDTWWALPVVAVY